MYDYIPRLPEGSVQYAAFASIDKMTFEPDVLILTATVDQAQTLLRSINFSTGEPFESRATPVVSCSWIYIYPIISGKLNYSVTGLGLGMQALDIFPPGLFLISVPFQQISTMLENLEEMYHPLPADAPPPPRPPGGDAHRKRVNKLMDDLRKRLKE